MEKLTGGLAGRCVGWVVIRLFSGCWKEVGYIDGVVSSLQQCQSGGSGLPDFWGFATFVSPSCSCMVLIETGTPGVFDEFFPNMIMSVHHR